MRKRSNADARAVRWCQYGDCSVLDGDNGRLKLTGGRGNLVDESLRPGRCVSRSRRQDLGATAVLEKSWVALARTAASGARVCLFQEGGPLNEDLRTASSLRVTKQRPIFGDAEPTSLDEQKKGVESNTRCYRISRQPPGPKYFLYRTLVGLASSATSHDLRASQPQ